MKYLLIFLPFLSNAAILNSSIYINSGYYHTFNNDSFPSVAFNNTKNFSQQNYLILLEENDTLVLSIINNDSINHGFSLKNYSINHTVFVGDTIIDTLILENGITVYYDNYQNLYYLGGGGIIAKGSKAKSSFYWNIKEHDKIINNSIVNGENVNLSTFNPTYYAINGKSKSKLNTDTLAKVVGVVGDTILIYVANTGNSVHSIHFHGYHCKVLFSTKSITDVGRGKDTFPLFPMQGIVLEMIPDKPGMYPVHDHNLIAATGGGTYPNGIFLMMEIAP